MVRCPGFPQSGSLLRSGVHGFAAAILLAALSGCGGTSQTAADLEQSLTVTQTAVRSARLVLQQRQQGRTTRAVAVTTAEDMAEAAADAQRGLADVSAPTEHDRVRREETMVAVAAAVETLADVEEAARNDGDLGSSIASLGVADVQIGTVLGRVRAAE